MKIFKNMSEWIKFRKTLAGRIGFVPTMGALHGGHASLMKRCHEECDISVASVFVNPVQFNDPKDLEKYPRTPEADAKTFEDNGADYIIFPEYNDVYPDGYRYKVTESDLSKTLCGASRPGHFDGVLTVVMKLFNMVRPDRAYFGEKDYQQLLLIKGMAEAFFTGVEVVPCPTVRESTGLAMSSRNALIEPALRPAAPEFYRALSSGRTVAEIRSILEAKGFIVDYIEEYAGRIFGAAFLGKVRLIDNVER